MSARKVIPLLLIAAGLVVYQNSFRGPFILDDLAHIVENPRIRHLWPPGELLTHTSRPVVHFTLAVNFALGGLDVRGYHAMNLAIHLLAALTLWGIIRRTLARNALGTRPREASEWLAGVVALIWLVHPLQVQTVTYIIQRAESLMALFYLLTLYLVIRGSQAPRPAGWYAGAVSCCALGMASKPVMATAPLMVLLYDSVFLSASFRDALRRRRGLYVGLAAAWVLLPILLAQAPVEWRTSAGFDAETVSPIAYALTQAGVILHYLRISFWPHPLCFDYAWPVAKNPGEILPQAIVVGLLLLGTIWAVVRRWPMGFAGAWFFLILAPTSSVIPVADIAVEHRMYLPLAGLIAAVVVAGDECLRVLGGRFGWRDRARERLAAVLVVAVATGLGLLTLRRNHDYRTHESIWRDTLAKRPDNARAHNNLGGLLEDRGQLNEAMTHYREAVALKPGYAEAHNNLGAALDRLGRFDEAIGHYQEAVRLRPDYAAAHNNLGSALDRAGRFEEALAHFKEAARLGPGFAAAHFNLATALDRQGKPAAAINHYRIAIHLDPAFVEAHYNLGVILAEQDKLDEAIAQFAQVLHLQPGNAQAHFNWGLALFRGGNRREATRHFERALQLDPGLEPARRALETLGR